MNRSAFLRVGASAFGGLVVLLFLGRPASFSTSDESFPLEILPGPEVQEIEIVLIDGKAPKATFRSTPTPSTEPKVVELKGKAVDLLPRLGEPVALDECEAEALRTGKSLKLTPRGAARPGCRWLFPLGSKDELLDILSFDSLSLKGSSVGSFSFALAERIGTQLGSGREIAKLSGKLDAKLSLAMIAALVDLRRIAGVLVVAGAGAKTLAMDRMGLTASSPDSSGDVRTGLWLWDYKEAVRDPKTAIDACLLLHCTRMSVQIPDVGEEDAVWKSYAQFLSAAQKKGIEALALDGYPEAVLDPEPLIRRLEKALSLPGNAVAGIQLDIEPYLLPPFAANPEEGDRRYVELISRLSTLIGEKSNLSVVMPFWFVHRRTEGYPVGFSVMNMVDDVAVMSYRTSQDEFLEISNDWVRYSRLTGIPVWLAVETRSLPVEEHIVLVFEPNSEAAQAHVDAASSRLIFQAPKAEGASGFRIRERYQVRPERLSFAGRSKKAVEEFVSAIMSKPAATGISGLMIHDWPGYTLLPD